MKQDSKCAKFMKLVRGLENYGNTEKIKKAVCFLCVFYPV